MENIEEKIEQAIEIARKRNMGWLPLHIEDAEAILRSLSRRWWGIGQGETVVVSRKPHAQMAMRITKGGEAFTSIEGASDDSGELFAAINSMLDDVKAITDALVEEAMRVVEEKWTNG